MRLEKYQNKVTNAYAHERKTHELDLEGGKKGKQDPKPDPDRKMLYEIGKEMNR